MNSWLQFDGFNVPMLGWQNRRKVSQMLALLDGGSYNSAYLVFNGGLRIYRLPWVWRLQTRVCIATPKHRIRVRVH
jgi:hypothetical protein